MSATFLSVLPVFLLILSGWFMVTSGYLKPETGEAVGDFVFKVALPVLLMRTMIRADAHGASPLLVWIAYFAAVAVTWTLAHLMATRLFRRDRRIGVLSGVSAAFANNVFIGLPLVIHLVGEKGVVAVSILLAVHLPLMMVAGTVLMERAEARETGGAAAPVMRIVLQVGRNLLTNPLIIGIFLGLAWRFSGFGLDGIAAAIINPVADLAGPSALIALGMAVRRHGLSGEIGLASALGGLKLLCLPFFVWVFTLLFGLDPAWQAALIITSSVPTGVNAWLIASRFKVGEALASSTIALTTFTGFVTVSFWVFFVGF